MTEAEFNQQLDDLFIDIEDAVDELDLDVDCENSGGVLTITCPDQSAMIFSRQPATKQLWLATKGGAFHFEGVDDRWQCTRSGRSLDSILEEASVAQLGSALTL